MSGILALDQGTTGSTAMVFDPEGKVVGRAYREFTQHFPEPGWVEHDAEEIFEVTCRVAREAIAAAGVEPAAVGITNQRETTVCWDRKSGRPLGRALVWQDRRTTERCKELLRELGPEFVASRTGLVWDPYFSGTKVEWLLRQDPDLVARAESGEVAFGTIDSWLIYRLTEGESFVTDPTNASRTLLYNIHDRDWDPDLLDLFGVPRRSLPAVRLSSEVVGEARAQYLGVEAPIAGIAGDQQAALFGQGCWEPGRAKCTYGTGAFILMPLDPGRETAGDSRGILTTVGCDSHGQAILVFEGSVFIAGAAVQWLRDGLGLIAEASETEEMARGVSSTGGVYFVPAFVGLGAPHWEPDARGTVVGITRGTRKEHLVRASLEAIAYSVTDVAQAMADLGGAWLEELRVDGGAAQNDWLLQFQADTLGCRVARPEVVETTARGAAGLAGLAVGMWRSGEEFAAQNIYEDFTPAGTADTGRAAWLRAVETAKFWAGA